jgi:tRNA-2-methylthio-N6-dimethylallyladenosine synthase
VEAMQERIALESNAPYIGRIEEVLIESHQVAGGQHQWRGRNRTNKLVFLPANRPGAASGLGADVRPGDLVDVRIDRATAWSLQGQHAIQ